MKKTSQGLQLKRLAQVALLAAGASSLMPAQAAVVATYTLDQLLLPGVSVTVGDKVFSDFGYSYIGMDVTAANVDVKFDDNIGGNIGVTFDGEWSLNNALGATLQHATADLDYKVTVTKPGWYISDFHLDGSFSAVPPGSGAYAFATLEPSDASHTVIPTTPVAPSTLPLTVSNGGSYGYVPNASSLVSGANKPTTVFVHSDLELYAPAGSTVAIPNMDHSFSQSAPVPEPSTYAMVLAGLGMMGAFLGRRRATRG